MADGRHSLQVSHLILVVDTLCVSHVVMTPSNERKRQSLVALGATHVLKHCQQFQNITRWYDGLRVLHPLSYRLMAYICGRNTPPSQQMNNISS
jgi:hypothetical protein